jgi:hypothetical protein
VAVVIEIKEGATAAHGFGEQFFAGGTVMMDELDS